MKLEDIKIGQRVMVKSCKDIKNNVLCKMIGMTEEHIINLCKKNNGFTVARIENNTILCGNGDRLENGDYVIGAGRFYPEELELIEDYEEIPFIPLADKKEEKANLNEKLAKTILGIALLKTLLSIDDDDSDK